MSTPETDAVMKYCKGIPEKDVLPYVAGHARSLERRNSELTAELEDLRQFKKEVDGEGVVPATRVLDKERQVSELTARIAELERNVEFYKGDRDSMAKLVADLEKEHEKTVAALAEARKDSAWRPIATAPKDGTKILVYAQEVSNPPLGDEKLPPIVSECTWHKDAGFCVCQIRSVTHWMPLPATPNPETEETI